MSDHGQPTPRRRGCLRMLLWLLVLAAVAFALARTFVVQRVTVPESVTYMSPALQPGGHAWIDKLSYRISSPRRSDIVATRAKGGQAILRIVALPGETVEARAGKLWVNGAPLAESYARGELGLSFAPRRLAADQYFVLADDREAYASPRVPWGAVARRPLLGRVLPAGE